MTTITPEQVEEFRQCLLTFCDDDEKVIMEELVATWFYLHEPCVWLFDNEYGWYKTTCGHNVKVTDFVLGKFCFSCGRKILSTTWNKRS